MFVLILLLLSVGVCQIELGSCSSPRACVDFGRQEMHSRHAAKSKAYFLRALQMKCACVGFELLIGHSLLAQSETVSQNCGRKCCVGRGARR